MPVGRLTRGFANPMTTAADIIVGGTAGAPARLAKGADGAYLRVDPATHLLVWAAVAAPTLAAVLAAGASANGVNISDLVALIAKATQTLVLQGEAGAGAGASGALLDLMNAQVGTGDDRRAGILQGGSGPAGIFGGYAALQGGSGNNLGSIGAWFKAFGGGAGVTAGKVGISSSASTGAAGEALTAAGDGTAAWGSTSSAKVTDDPTGRAALTGTDVFANLGIADGLFSDVIPGSRPAGAAVNDTDVDVVDLFGDGFPQLATLTYGVITAHRTVNLPSLATMIAEPGSGIGFRLTVGDASGSCAAGVKIKIISPDAGSILNGGAGPAPATEVDLATPYASIELVFVSTGGFGRGWMIVARGPVA